MKKLIKDRLGVEIVESNLDICCFDKGNSICFINLGTSFSYLENALKLFLSFETKQKTFRT